VTWQLRRTERDTGASILKLVCTLSIGSGERLPQTRTRRQLIESGLRRCIAKSAGEHVHESKYDAEYETARPQGQRMRCGAGTQDTAASFARGGLGQRKMLTRDVFGHVLRKGGDSDALEASTQGERTEHDPSAARRKVCRFRRTICALPSTVLHNLTEASFSSSSFVPVPRQRARRLSSL